MKQGGGTALLIAHFILPMTTTIPPTIVHQRSAIYPLPCVPGWLQEEEKRKLFYWFDNGIVFHLESDDLSIMDNQFVALGESLLATLGFLGGTLAVP